MGLLTDRCICRLTLTGWSTEQDPFKEIADYVKSSDRVFDFQLAAQSDKHLLLRNDENTVNSSFNGIDAFLWDCADNYFVAKVILELSKRFRLPAIRLELCNFSTYYSETFYNGVSQEVINIPCQGKYRNRYMSIIDSYTEAIPAEVTKPKIVSDDPWDYIKFSR